MPDGETKLIRGPDGGAALWMRRIRIVVVDGPDRGLEVTPDKGIARIGTHSESDLVLTDPAVSRHHCELRVGEERVRVLDFGSANGTFVEGLRVRDVEMSPGTLMRMGESTLRVTTAEDTIRIPLSDADRFGALLGESVRMREVFAILERVAPTDTTLLLEGESGTGKELAAEGVHAASPRADGPLVVFDCGAVPHDLVESALFGHVRGAFTGAVADRAGVFEEASGGTLFLDEVGELPLDLQPKLLRAIEKREVRRVGATVTSRVDVRIIAATNRALDAEVNSGRFREDLYYRLAVVKVLLPPLRSRPEDIPRLVAHFLRLLAPPGREPPKISGRALAALGARPWPGNVRELRNAVERAVSIAGEDAFSSETATVQDAAADPGEGVPFHVARERAIDAFERRWLEAALRRSGGNVSAAARDAGVNRKLVQRMMKRHGMR